MFEALSQRVLQRTLEIQRIPAPTFEEGERAAFVRAAWEAEGVQTWLDEVGNVYAHVPASGRARPIVVTAHLDTVFPKGTPLQVRIRGQRWYGPGIGDNSLGVAALFGLFWALRASERRLARDLYLVANVAEEGLGNLKGMRAVVARFRDQVQAYIVLEGLALGKVYHRGLGVRRYRVRVQAPGGHAWGAYGMPSAIHVAARMVAEWSQWELPRQPKTTMNVGTFHGGRGVNVIADEAVLEVEWRSEDARMLATWCQRFEEVCRRYQGERVQVTWEVIGERPVGGLPAHHPLVQAALHSAWAHGIEARLAVGSTDANVPLSQGYPAITVGLTVGGGAHSLEEFIDITPLPQGLAALWDLVLRVDRMP